MKREKRKKQEKTGNSLLLFYFLFIIYYFESLAQFLLLSNCRRGNELGADIGPLGQASA